MARNDFAQGFGSVVEEIIGGIAISLLINAISATGLIPPTYILIIELVNIVALASLLFIFQKAGFAYIAGWIFGIYIMIQSGLMGFWDIILYLIAPIVIIGIRVYLGFKNEGY
jgi:hypothetical protein